MGRMSDAIGSMKAVSTVAQELEAEVEIEDGAIRPEDIPADVWAMIQENGRLATERLHELLSSLRFTRLRPADQAKLIALAQNRAYGNPVNKQAQSDKRRAGRFDVTAASLNALVHRATLPEYKKSALTVVEDADFEAIDDDDT